MARPLQSHHHLPSLSTTTTTPFLLLLAVAAVASIVVSLCTTRKHSLKIHHPSKKTTTTVRPPPPPEDNNIERKLIATLSGIGSKALVVAKMVSWKRPSEEEEEEVWRKSILMGEKCRPLDFSGQILYDSEGKEVKEIIKHASG